MPQLEKALYSIFLYFWSMEERWEGLEVFGYTCVASGSLFHIVTDELHVLPMNQAGKVRKHGNQESRRGAGSVPCVKQ